jgi:O-antigen ligase
MLIVSTVVLMIIHKMLKLGLVFIILFVALFLLFANTNIEGLNPFRVVSSEARLKSAHEAVEIFSKSPILGVGFNSYRYAQIRYGTRSGGGVASSHADAGTDNSYLFVLATTGIVGFLFFIDFLFNIVKVSLKKIGKKEFFPEITLASVIGIGINCIFLNSLFYAPIMAWLFILIGITVNKRR